MPHQYKQAEPEALHGEQLDAAYHLSTFLHLRFGEPLAASSSMERSWRTPQVARGLVAFSEVFMVHKSSERLGGKRHRVDRAM